MSKEKKCKLCQNGFHAEHGNSKFCSQKCFDAFYDNYRKNWKRDHPKVESSYVKDGSRAYNNIKQRTGNPNNPQYANYGARGIYCELTREEFKVIYFSTDSCELCGKDLNDENRSGPDGRTLDRIDQARSYEKGNLRILCRACNTRLAFNRRKNKL